MRLARGCGQVVEAEKAMEDEDYFSLPWLVMGWIRFLEGGRNFDCINHPNTAYAIPVQVEEVQDIISVADYILVVEKESVFERLANDQFCNTNCCIVITGRGYPDIPTRRFLRLLIEKLCLPNYCLVDCDPNGFDILTTYQFGSMVRFIKLLMILLFIYHTLEQAKQHIYWQLGV
ncbi:meiotic recombination protein SPO11-1-like [Castanea sativa]|uniref:meiotic recombination protein SPO11-1-like n=1 Tax=Castanea sativa TaxID=21020 RepID=UPI003F64BE1A